MATSASVAPIIMATAARAENPRKEVPALALFRNLKYVWDHRIAHVFYLGTESACVPSLCIAYTWHLIGVDI